jgi:hypothetical protein
MDKFVLQSDYDAHPETVETEKQLSNYLTKIAKHIGWIVIYFNSLEDVLAQSLREMMLTDPYQDERLDVFLAEMGYRAKANALIHLYGQAIAHGVPRLAADELKILETALSRAAAIRNGYAHADWIGVRTGAYIKVKTNSSKNGIVHRYKKIDVNTANLDLDFIVSLRDRLEAVHELIQDQIYDRLSADGANHVLPRLRGYPVGECGPTTGATSEEVHLYITNALLSLGYSDQDASLALKRVPERASVSDGLKAALKVLGYSK